MPVPHHSVLYRPDALPASQPTDSVKALKALKALKAHKNVCDYANMSIHTYYGRPM